MRILSTLVLLAAVLVAAPGCATLFSGSSDTITFNSEPSGADVVIDGLSRGRTPVSVPVKRAGFGDRTVTLRLDGYDPVTFQLADGFNAVSILNVFVPIGFIVDAATGSITKYTQKGYSVDMARGSVAQDMRQLERTADGAVVVPASAGDLLVTDEATGLTFAFEK